MLFGIRQPGAAEFSVARPMPQANPLISMTVVLTAGNDGVKVITAVRRYNVVIPSLPALADGPGTGWYGSCVMHVDSEQVVPLLISVCARDFTSTLFGSTRAGKISVEQPEEN